MTTATIVPNQWGVSIYIPATEAANIDYMAMCARMIAGALARIQRVAAKQDDHCITHTWEQTEDNRINYRSIMRFNSDREWTLDEIDAANEARTPEEVRLWEHFVKESPEWNLFWTDERLYDLGRRMDLYESEDRALTVDITADILASFCEAFPEFVTGA